MARVLARQAPAARDRAPRGPGPAVYDCQAATLVRPAADLARQPVPAPAGVGGAGPARGGVAGPGACVASRAPRDRAGDRPPGLADPPPMARGRASRSREEPAHGAGPVAGPR